MALLKATNPTMVAANSLVMACALIGVSLMFFAPHLYWAGAYWIHALVIWQVFNIVGISAGAHRYFSHGAFKCNRFWQWVMAHLCMVSLVGPPCIWAEAHVRHHLRSDKPDDPYARFAIGGGSAIDHTTRVTAKFLRVATKDSLHRITLRWYWGFVIAHAVVVVSIGVLFAINPLAALFWFYLVPAGLSQITLRFILWTGHLRKLGYRNHEIPDTSNNWWFASLISGGEGWHNNHHAYPFRAKMGERWWEIDPTWWFIRAIRQ